jgi:hypothetical protein
MAKLSVVLNTKLDATPVRELLVRQFQDGGVETTLVILPLVEMSYLITRLPHIPMSLGCDFHSWVGLFLLPSISDGRSGAPKARERALSSQLLKSQLSFSGMMASGLDIQGSA